MPDISIDASQLPENNGQIAFKQNFMEELVDSGFSYNRVAHNRVDSLCDSFRSLDNQQPFVKEPFQPVPEFAREAFSESLSASLAVYAKQTNNQELARLSEFVSTVLPHSYRYDDVMEMARATNPVFKSVYDKEFQRVQQQEKTRIWQLNNFMLHNVPQTPVFSEMQPPETMFLHHSSSMVVNDSFKIYGDFDFYKQQFSDRAESHERSTDEVRKLVEKFAQPETLSDIRFLFRQKILQDKELTKALNDISNDFTVRRQSHYLRRDYERDFGENAQRQIRLDNQYVSDKRSAFHKKYGKKLDAMYHESVCQVYREQVKNDLSKGKPPMDIIELVGIDKEKQQIRVRFNLPDEQNSKNLITGPCMNITIENKSIFDNPQKEISLLLTSIRRDYQANYVDTFRETLYDSRYVKDDIKSASIPDDIGDYRLRNRVAHLAACMSASVSYKQDYERRMNEYKQFQEQEKKREGRYFGLGKYIDRVFNSSTVQWAERQHKYFKESLAEIAADEKRYANDYQPLDKDGKLVVNNLMYAQLKSVLQTGKPLSEVVEQKNEQHAAKSIEDKMEVVLDLDKVHKKERGARSI